MKLAPRLCPVCITDDAMLHCGSNIDFSKLDAFAFASRKFPELMRHRLMRCKNCSVLYANPAPQEGTLHQEYENASFDSMKEAGDAARTYISYLPASAPKGKTLDIGAGGGEFLGELLKRGFQIEGIEPSPAAIATAAADVKPHIRQGMFEAANYTPESYVLVSCFQTLEHVTEPLAISKAAYSLLQKGGIYFTICHNEQGGLNKILGTKSPIYDIEHLQLFSPKSIAMLMKNAGFSHVDVFPIWNRYPLSYWMKLLPLPQAVKQKAMALAKACRLGNIPIAAPVGNMGIVAIK